MEDFQELIKVKRSEIKDKYSMYPSIDFKTYIDGKDTTTVGITYIEKDGYLVSIRHNYTTFTSLVEASEPREKLKILINFSLIKVQKFYNAGMEVYDTKGCSIDIKIIEDE